MIRAVRYFPTFVERGDEPPETAEVGDLAALYRVPWIARWKDDPRFHRFSLADGIHLMAELRGGREWWVIATIAGSRRSLRGLPEWRPPKGWRPRTVPPAITIDASEPHD